MELVLIAQHTQQQQLQKQQHHHQQQQDDCLHWSRGFQGFSLSSFPLREKLVCAFNFPKIFESDF
jgi:hypothetical protein